MERQKKVAIFNDLSGFGRCSISVMLPILSVMGHQGVAIPTADPFHAYRVSALSYGGLHRSNCRRI